MYASPIDPLDAGAPSHPFANDNCRRHDELRALLAAIAEPKVSDQLHDLPPALNTALDEWLEARAGEEVRLFDSAAA